MDYKKLKTIETKLIAIYEKIDPFLDDTKKAVFDEILQRISIYQIALVGAPGLGKTTALDAIIRKKLMPVSGSGATTGVPVYIYHKEEPISIEVKLKDATIETIEPNALENYINSVEHKRADVKEIIIKTPISFIAEAPISNNFCLIDTPGEGTAGAKDHTETTRLIIKQTDGLIIFVNQRQLTDENVKFISKDIAAVRQDLIHKDSGALNFDEKVFIVLSRMDEDEKYLKDTDGTYLEGKKKSTVEILKKEGFDIKPDKVFALAAEMGLLCLLVSQEMDKDMREISLTDLESYKNLLERGDSKSRVIRLIGLFDNFLNVQNTQLNKNIFLSDLYTLSGLDKLLHSLYKYLCETDIKTPPLKKAIEMAISLADEQDKVLVGEQNRLNIKLKKAEEEENNRLKQSNKDYLFEVGRIESKKQKLEANFERDKANLEKQIEKHKNILNSQPTLLENGVLKAKENKWNLEKEIKEYELEVIKSIKETTQAIVNKYNGMVNRIYTEPFNWQCQWQMQGWNFYYRMRYFRHDYHDYQHLSCSSRVPTENIRGGHRQISNELAIAHNSHSNEMAKILNQLRNKVNSFLNSLEFSLYILPTKPEINCLLKEYSPQYENLFFDPNQPEISHIMSCSIVLINGVDCDRYVTADPNTQITKATQKKCTEVDEVFKNYVQTLNKAFKKIKKNANEALNHRKQELMEKIELFSTELSQIKEQFNRDLKSLEDALNSYSAPNIEVPPQNEEIIELKNQIENLSQQRNKLSKEIISPLNTLLNQLKHS